LRLAKRAACREAPKRSAALLPQQMFKHENILLLAAVWPKVVEKRRKSGGKVGKVWPKGAPMRRRDMNMGGKQVGRLSWRQSVAAGSCILCARAACQLLCWPAARFTDCLFSQRGSFGIDESANMQSEFCIRRLGSLLAACCTVHCACASRTLHTAHCTLTAPAKQQHTT